MTSETVGHKEAWYIKHDYPRAAPWEFDTLDEALGAFNSMIQLAHEYINKYKFIALWHYSHTITEHQKVVVETLLQTHDLVKEASGAYYGGP